MSLSCWTCPWLHPTSLWCNCWHQMLYIGVLPCIYPMYILRSCICSNKVLGWAPCGPVGIGTTQYNQHRGEVVYGPPRGEYQYPGAHKGPNQVPYCYIRRTLVYTLGAYTEELLHTTFDANSCTNG